MNAEAKIFTIPQTVLDKVVNILASLPYGQVAPVMAELNKVIAPQIDQDKGVGK
jgi:hypothetical protein